MIFTLPEKSEPKRAISLRNIGSSTKIRTLCGGMHMQLQLGKVPLALITEQTAGSIDHRADGGRPKPTVPPAYLLHRATSN